MTLNSPSKTVRGYFHRFLIVIEQWSLARLLSLFAGVIFLFAVIFYLLGGLWGGADAAHANPLSFSDALYFSVVTISSLGYGDVLPVGWSRLFAASEVLLGLAIMGIIVAKLSSAGISHHVRRLYESDIRLRLTELADDFGFLAEKLEEVIASAADTFADAPTASEAERENRQSQMVETERHVGDLIEKFRKHSLRMKEYVCSEIQHGVFFIDEAAPAITTTGEQVERLVGALDVFVHAIPLRIRMKLLQQSLSNKRRLLEGLEFSIEVCEEVKKNSNNQEMLGAFNALHKSCLRFPQEMFNFPDAKPTQPDQVVVVGNEPQS